MVCGMNKKNELVMGGSLAVKLANLWLEEHEFTLLKDVPNVIDLPFQDSSVGQLIYLLRTQVLGN